VLVAQLQKALNSRIVIEQAKGLLSERNAISLDAAFQALRRYARRHNKSITEAAADVVDGTWNANVERN